MVSRRIEHRERANGPSATAIVHSSLSRSHPSIRPLPRPVSLWRVLLSGVCRRAVCGGRAALSHPPPAHHLLQQAIHVISTDSIQTARRAAQLEWSHATPSVADSPLCHSLLLCCLCEQCAWQACRCCRCGACQDGLCQGRTRRSQSNWKGRKLRQLLDSTRAQADEWTRAATARRLRLCIHNVLMPVVCCAAAFCVALALIPLSSTPPCDRSLPQLPRPSPRPTTLTTTSWRRCRTTTRTRAQVRRLRR